MITNIDLRRILTYLEKVFNINDSELSKSTGVSTSTISRIRTGGTDDPRISNLKPIADYFKLTIGQLVGYEPLPSKLSPKANIIQNINLNIPLILWQQAPNFETLVSDLNPYIWDKWIPVNASLSKLSYALTIEQKNLERPFKFGSNIIIDPLEEAADRDYVIINRSNENSATLKQWIIDGDNIWLKPLQPDLDKKLFNKSDKVCGIVQIVIHKITDKQLNR